MRNWIEMDIQYHVDAITVSLLEEEEVINLTETPLKTKWDYVFDEFPEFDIPADYKAKSGEYDPVNIQIQTEILGRKRWLNDNPKKRPESITIHLLANKEKIATKIVTAKNNWTYQFSNVPEYDVDGGKITYKVKEQAIEGYTTTYRGYTIINYYNN